MRSRIQLLLAVLFSSALAGAQSTPQRSLLALSKQNYTLAIVDPVSLKVIARAPIGPDPHEVIASSDGKTAYVSIYGGGRYHAFSVIDLVGQKALPDIDTGALSGPHGVTFVGGKLWFTAEGSKAIARYDPAAAKIDWIMGTGQNRTHMIYVTADQKQIYTTNISSGSVTILEKVTLPSPDAEPRTDWNETVIEVGKSDEGFDVSPDGRGLWTANAQEGTLSVIDIASKKVIATLDAKVVSANRLKFTPDGKLVLISSLNNGDLVIYDAASRKEHKRVKIGHGAAGILMDPEGNRAFIACSADNYVAILDLQTLEVKGHLDVGGEPDGLAWALRLSVRNIRYTSGRGRPLQPLEVQRPWMRFSWSCILKYANSRGCGNVVIPQGFPKSVGRVESRFLGFPPFPYFVISMACFGNTRRTIEIPKSPGLGAGTACPKMLDE